MNLADMTLFELEELKNNAEEQIIIVERHEKVERLKRELKQAEVELEHPELNQRCDNCNCLHDGSHDESACNYLNR